MGQDRGYYVRSTLRKAFQYKALRARFDSAPGHHSNCGCDTASSTIGKRGTAGLDALDFDAAAYPPDEKHSKAVGHARTRERDNYVFTVTDTDQMF